MPKDKRIFEMRNSQGDTALPSRASYGVPSRRRSSFATRLSKDPRNVRRDKDRNIRFLSEFLAERDFPDDVSPQTLKSPAINYVKNIFLLIFHQFNSSLNDFSALGFEDYVKCFLQLLGYPFNLSRSYLQAPGALNAWPHVLAAIVWLIELLQYRDALENGRAACREADALNALELTAEQYQSFLRGSDIEEAQQKIGEFHTDRQNELRRQKDEIYEEIDAIQTEIAALETRPDAKGAFTESRKLSEDAEKFTALADKTQSHLATVIKRRHRYEAAEKTVRSKMKELDLQEAYAKYELDKQKVSKDDVAQMSLQRQKLQSELTRISESLLHKTKKLSKAESNHKRRESQLQIKADALNDELRLVGAVPVEAKYAYGYDYALSLDLSRSVTEEDDVAALLQRSTSVDLKGSLKPHLLRICKLLNEEKTNLVTEKTRLETYLRDLNTRERQALKEREDAKTVLDNLKHLNEAKLKAFEEEREKANNELFQQKMHAFAEENSSESLVQLMNRYNGLVSREKEIENECVVKSHKKTSEVMKAMEKFLDYRAHRVEEFKQLQDLTEKLSVAFPRLK